MRKLCQNIIIMIWISYGKGSVGKKENWDKLLRIMTYRGKNTTGGVVEAGFQSLSAAVWGAKTYPA